MKLRDEKNEAIAKLSPSLRGRGLKYQAGNSIDTYIRVALFTRAWIEIFTVLCYNTSVNSRPLYEGVDRNFLPCPMRLSPQFYSKARLEVDDILFHNP